MITQSVIHSTKQFMTLISIVRSHAQHSLIEETHALVKSTQTEIHHLLPQECGIRKVFHNINKPKKKNGTSHHFREKNLVLGFLVAIKLWFSSSRRSVPTWRLWKWEQRLQITFQCNVQGQKKRTRELIAFIDILPHMQAHAHTRTHTHFHGNLAMKY